MRQQTDMKEYAKRRAQMTCELISDAKISAQKRTLQRRGIEYTRREATLFVTPEDHKKIQEAQNG